MSLKRDIQILLKYDSLKRALGYDIYNPIKLVKGVKVMFIHIPKNGGTSIGPTIGYEKRKHFELNLDGSGTIEDLENAKKTLQHRDAKELYTIVGKRNWEQSFRFSFVRNPWDRMYSWYKYKVSINHHQMKSNPINFNSWIEAVCSRQTLPYYHSKKIYQPQFNWLSLNDTDLALDFVGKFEDLDKDFQHIANLIGLSPVLPHYNKAKVETDYRAVYNQRSVDLVSEFYKKDVEYWNYEF